MSDPAKVVLIAALEREIRGLSQGWEQRWVEDAGKGFKAKYWRSGDVVAIAVGMGWDRASRGTKVVIETFCPELVTSIGFSGSLSPRLPVGSIFIPAQVVGFKNGDSYSTGVGEGTLITAAGVAGVRDKAEMAERFGAVAVDMEAAAVAGAARDSKVRFAALRVISDGVEDEMDFVGAFVTPAGFRTGAFLAHIAIRPKLWGALLKLAANTQKATEALTKALQEFVCEPDKFLVTRSVAVSKPQVAAKLARK
jgi:adenosylhomocysteine nucleosidase